MSSQSRKKYKPTTWDPNDIAKGEHKEFSLEIAESYSGITIKLPFIVFRGQKSGPTVFITAAIHGDEINGTGVIRDLIVNEPFKLQRGTLILVPVANIQGFERISRYLPDRRDLNRCFPGAKSGSLSGRLASSLFKEIIRPSDYGIDLHSAALRRTNFPHIRADMSNPQSRQMAEAFGTEIILDSPGPNGSLRNEATKASCSTIVFEAGETCKVETSYMETALRGIKNVLSSLNMINEQKSLQKLQIICSKTVWLRAENGGFLQFHISPGDRIAKEQEIATSTDLLGNEMGVIKSPYTGVIIGMNTMPAVSPGDPVVHVAITDASDNVELTEFYNELLDDSIGFKVREELATNIHIVEFTENDQ